MSRVAKLERSDTYRVLSRLASKGFVIKVLDVPTKYAIAPPEKAFKRGFDQKHHELIQLEGEVDKLKDFFDYLKKESASAGSARFEVLDSSRHVYDRVAEMLSPERCKHEVMYYANEECGRRIAYGLQEILEEALKRQVRVRLMMPITGNNLEFAKVISKFAEVRHIPSASSRIVIVDRNEFMGIYSRVNVKTVEGYDDVGVWASHAPFAETQASLYESQWSLAMPLRSRIRQIQKANSKRA